MTYRVRNLVIAVGLALVAMMLTFFYVTNYKRSVQHSEADVTVYVAAHDVAPGVSGSELVKTHAIQPMHVPRRTAVSGAIASPDDIEKLVLSEQLYQGEQVTVRRFADVAAQGVRAQLKGTMRAIQVPGDSNQLLAGTLKAGDHVDFVGVVARSSNNDVKVSRIVLRDLPVFQAPTAANEAARVASGDYSVMLGVTDVQVQRLWYVHNEGKWSLELRPVVDAADTKRERAENGDTVINDGLTEAEYNRLLRGAR